jgi:hypothetical protein
MMHGADCILFDLLLCVILRRLLARPAERLYPDGSWFCWLDRAAGTGTLFHADGSEKRSGMWKDGMLEGMGQHEDGANTLCDRCVDGARIRLF